jgi:glutathione S-transferase
MKLRFAPQSPYVRKVMVFAHELGCLEQLEIVTTAAHPVERNRELITANPLGQIPALELADGHTLYDSRVICEFLNDSFGGTLFPPRGMARWYALTEQALADGMLAASLLARYESAARPPEHQWQTWLTAQLDKVTTGLQSLEDRVDTLQGRFDIGVISIACAMGYLDLRFPAVEWRDRLPALAEWEASISQRPSLQKTRPV